MELWVPLMPDLNISHSYKHERIELCSIPSESQVTDLFRQVWWEKSEDRAVNVAYFKHKSWFVVIFQMFSLQCQKRYFSAWHKLILDHRIKLGKAGTLSDWKLQLKVLRAWRDYTRSQKMERETQALENDLREENRYITSTPKILLVCWWSRASSLWRGRKSTPETLSSTISYDTVVCSPVLPQLERLNWKWEATWLSD